VKRSPGWLAGRGRAPWMQREGGPADETGEKMDARRRWYERAWPGAGRNPESPWWPGCWMALLVDAAMDGAPAGGFVAGALSSGNPFGGAARGNRDLAVRAVTVCGQ
jgi:hypothetical protein